MLVYIYFSKRLIKDGNSGRTIKDPNVRDLSPKYSCLRIVVLNNHLKNFYTFSKSNHYFNLFQHEKLKE